MPSLANLGRQSAMFTADGLGKNKDEVLGVLGTGYDKTMAYGQQANSFYDPYAQRYNTASAMSLNALGLGGEQGNQAALGAFNNSPQAMLMQQRAAQDAQGYLRGASARGMLGSGNTEGGLSTLLANNYGNTYNNWQGNLAQLDRLGLQTAGQQSQGVNRLGDLTNDYYGSRAGVIDDTNKGIIEAGRQAYSATAQGKQNQQNNWLGVANSAVGLLGKFAGGGFKFGG